MFEINNALKTASKHQTGKTGLPGYVAVVRDFVLVMEDKADRANLCLMEAGQISQTITAITDYAVKLTPRYITELFCELVDLKLTDVLFDPCCGFRVIRMKEANSSMKSRALKLLQKLKTENNERLCVA